MNLNFKKISTKNLLILYVEILKELRRKRVLKSSNNPVADYSEWLVSKKFDLTPEKNSTAGFDATDKKGKRYQIKGRRLTAENDSTELSVIRNLEKKPFDFLVAVVYKPNFTVDYAAQVPIKIVRKYARYSEHIHGWRFSMTRSILKKTGVIDLTKRFKGRINS